MAVPFKSLKVASRDGKDWLVLNQTKEDLKMAPAYDKKTNSQMMMVNSGGIPFFTEFGSNKLASISQHAPNP